MSDLSKWTVTAIAITESRGGAVFRRKNGAAGEATLAKERRMNRRVKRRREKK